MNIFKRNLHKMCNLYLCSPMSLSRKKAKEQMDNIMELQGEMDGCILDKFDPSPVLRQDSNKVLYF